jgi:prephenate dehydrogenase
MTRVSVSDAAFVAGLLHSNAKNQARVMRAFRERLDALCALLEEPTSRPLAKALKRAGTGRRS